MRICEIAFEAGFQSLTHFNRIFKKLVGQSPTEFREQLPAGTPQVINKHARPQFAGVGQLSSSRC
jgi:AraC-like DNA-binding protein